MKGSVDEITKNDNVIARLEQWPRMARFYRNCFYNTLETTTEVLDDGTAFVFTGDIPAMWLRDSSAQVRHYIPLAAGDDRYRQIIEGLIRRQMSYIRIDPYANAFNKEPNNQGHKGDLTEGSPWVWERKYEIDSLCYPIQLAYLYWQATGRTELFDDAFKETVNAIIGLWTAEQKHEEWSPYRFQRLNCPESDTLKNEGLGTPTAYTGMTWSAFRPSDDACAYHYLIPSNMFAVVALRYVQRIALDVYGDEALEAAAGKLCGEIDAGIRAYGIFKHHQFGDIYAYETDGLGRYNLMDDANVPSLLSIPYMGYAPADDPIYRNTRRFILSRENPYYYEGKAAKGIGSPHTPSGYIWHIGLTMQALTSDDDEEIRELLAMIVSTDAGEGFMHEGFHADNPAEYTRPWFAWANSLFGELIYKLVEGKKQHLFPSEA
ncbi:glycoside hydrolase family 125 protein [Paenibacillus arenilitoris]|uniref:Glycoside hydrolase family 125 protein n=1 Tax=Paenibacillus arenilitoris TaxID=2772299 RepID=A0A927CHX1_9BACL|nr:glycoside hydrolase family 125 protein [Paenibacillus arenilitoris]MBD2867357.1 glycoside hydrolase family 125 protein [Paenibacillus arenilitoris]